MASIGKRTDNGRWFVQYSIQGKVHRTAVKGNTRKLALKKKDLVERWLGEMDATGEMSVEPMTVSELGESYLARMDQVKPGTWRRMVWKVIEEHLGADLPVTAIDRAAAEKMGDSMMGAGHGPASVNRKRSVLRSALKWAAKRPEETGLREFRLEGWEKLDERQAKKKPIFLEEDELSRAIRHLDRPGGDWRALALKLDIETGMRLGEILDLEAKDVDLARGRVYARESKRGNSRWIRLSKGMTAALHRLKAGLSPGERLFPPQSLSRSALTVLWAETRRNAKIRPARIHDLRHTFASRLLLRGESLRTVQYLLGHKTIAATMIYAHFSREMPSAAPLAAPKTLMSRVVSASRRAKPRKPSKSLKRYGAQGRN